MDRRVILHENKPGFPIFGHLVVKYLKVRACGVPVFLRLKVTV